MTPSRPSPAAPAASDDRHWLVLGSMVFALFMVMLDMTVVTVALPSIQRNLNATEQSLEWTINAFSLGLASLTLLGGKMGDRFGRRRLFLVGLAIFTVSSAACALSQTDSQLVAGRAVQGAGGALMMTLSLSIIVAAFPPRRLPIALGIWAGTSAFGLAIGPLVGGLLVDNAGWASVFWINVPVGVAAIAVSWLIVPESNDPTTRALDVAGTVLATAGLFAFVWGLIDTSSNDWGSVDVITKLGVGLALIAAFVLREAYTREPMLPLRFFRSLRFSTANLVMLGLGFAMFGAIYFLTLYLQNVQGYSAVDTGLRSLPLTTMVILVAPPAGRLSARFGPRRFVITGMLLCALSVFELSGLRPDSPYSAMWPWLVVLGVGTAMTMPVLAAAAMSSAEEAKAGVASGILNTARQVGTALGVAVLGSIGATVARGDWSTATSGLPGSAQDKAHLLEPLVVLGQGGRIESLASQALGPALGAMARTQAVDAFCHGMERAFLAGAAVAVAAAGAAALGLAGRPASVSGEAAAAPAGSGPEVTSAERPSCAGSVALEAWGGSRRRREGGSGGRRQEKPGELGADVPHGRLGPGHGRVVVRVDRDDVRLAGECDNARRAHDRSTPLLLVPPAADLHGHRGACRSGVRDADALAGDDVLHQVEGQVAVRLVQDRAVVQLRQQLHHRRG
jgi:EmrB/QacA subfamily drug resistance transporter